MEERERAEVGGRKREKGRRRGKGRMIGRKKFEGEKIAGDSTEIKNRRAIESEKGGKPERLLEKENVQARLIVRLFGER